MKLRITLAVVLSLLAGIFAGRFIPTSLQLPLFDLLVTTAAIVFGVSGAWIALVHASELKAENPNGGRLRNLIRAMGVSGVTITIALVVFGIHTSLAAVWAPSASLAPWLRGGLFSLWVFLGLAQIWSLFAGLPSALFAEQEVEIRGEHRKRLDSLPPAARDDDTKQRSSGAKDP